MVSEIPETDASPAESRDLELINRAADELNAEVEEVLRYQATEE